MWHLRDIFVAGAYMATTCEADIAVACILTHLCKSIGSIYPYSIMAVCHIFAIWQLCLVTYQICIHIYIHPYTHLGMSAYINTYIHILI